MTCSDGIFGTHTFCCAAGA